MKQAFQMQKCIEETRMEALELRLYYDVLNYR